MTKSKASTKKIRATQFALCDIELDGKPRVFWCAWWSRPTWDSPDASGHTVNHRPTAEKAARGAIKAAQVDWRFTVADAGELVAGIAATVEGHRWKDPRVKVAKAAEDRRRKEERARQKAQREHDKWWEQIREKAKKEHEQWWKDVQAQAEKEAREYKRSWSAPSHDVLATPISSFKALKMAPTRDVAAINKAFRKLAFDAHPDRGGTHDGFVALNESYRAAKSWAIG